MDPKPISLAYANPRGGQPLGSAFVVELLPAGIALRRPLPAERYEAVAVVLVGGMVVALAALCAWGAVADRHRDWSNALMAVLAAALPFAAIALFGYARAVCRPRVQSVVLDNGCLTVTNGPWSIGRRQSFTARPRAFGAAASEFRLGQRRAMYNVTFRGRWGLGRPILTGLPRDECTWIVSTLNALLHAASAAEGDRHG